MNAKEFKLHQIQVIRETILKNGDEMAFEEVREEVIYCGTEVMFPEEKKALKAMPTTFTVFRGCSKDATNGYHWTLSSEVAKMFAVRDHYDRPRSDGVVVTGKVKRKDVIAYFFKTSFNINDEDAEQIIKGEEEILVQPDSVEVISSEPVVCDLTPMEVDWQEMKKEDWIAKYGQMQFWIQEGIMGLT